MRRFLSLVAVLVISSFSLSAQSIQYLAEKKIFLLTTKYSSYAMGLSPTGQLQHLYWGGPIWRTDDLQAAVERNDISSFDPH